MPTLYVKLLVGLILFGTWLALIIFKVQGADSLVAFIQGTLGVLVGYHAGQRDPKSQAPDQESGQ